VDLGPALASRRKRLAEVRAKLERKRAKLANEAFLSRAPAPVVEKERRDVAELEADEARLVAELAQLGDDAA
jgi:valyl-tRNA synthetase